jgi:hypothetical protein
MSLITYSASCTWWGPIEETGKNGPLPCCPYCGSVLFQEEKKKWDEGLKKHSIDHPGYDKFLKWTYDSKTCWRDLKDAVKRFEWQTKQEVKLS